MGGRCGKVLARFLQISTFAVFSHSFLNFYTLKREPDLSVTGLDEAGDHMTEEGKRPPTVDCLW